MKKIISLIMMTVVLFTFAFFAIGSLGNKKVVSEHIDETDSTVELTDESTEITFEDTQIEETSDYINQETPEIISAVTLNGSVLGASNVDKTRSFGAEKTIDNQYDTCWCVNTTNGGEGAKIHFELKEKSSVEGFKMVNGNLYQPETNIYKSNGQVKNFTLTFSDGSSKTFTAKYNEFASHEYEYFYFDEPVVTEYIILTVNSGYVGEKYTENVAIGEVDIY